MCPKCGKVFPRGGFQEHCCVSHLFKLVQLNKAIEDEDREKTNNGFQMLQQQMQQMQQRMNEDRGAEREKTNAALIMLQ